MLGDYKGASGATFNAKFKEVGGDYDYFSKGVREVLEKDDLSVGNLEGVLTDKDLKNAFIKPFSFKGPSIYTNILKRASIESVNIANNHTRDYGAQGFKDTLAILTQANIAHFGEGILDVREIKGRKFGFAGHRGWNPAIKHTAKKEIEAFQVSCLAYRGDMGDMTCCQEFFGQVKKQFGGVDVLVNNAGISYIGLLQDMTSEDWERMLHVNLTSVFNCCKLAIPYMLQQKQGKIINISSVWGSVGASCEAAYSATKGGVNALTKALAKELAPSNIQVNAVACGAIDTEMNQWMEEDELIALVEDIPAGRLGRAEEVADLVYHLGYKGTYLTGQVIGLDGGWF